MSDTAVSDSVLNAVKCLIEKDSLITTSLYYVRPDNLVTLNALEKSQEFYSNSFSCLIMLIGIVIAIVGLPSLWNWLKANKYNKDAEKKLREFEQEFKSQKKILKK